MIGWTHGDLLAWYDREWPDPMDAPEVLRVPADTFNAVLDGLTPTWRFCRVNLAEAGWPTVKLRPFGCLTSLVLDTTVDKPTACTEAEAIALAKEKWPLEAMDPADSAWAGIAQKEKP